ncbi:MAG: hypothetical protein ACTSRG_25085 [Candidatus Helarchaeota archaeon]
MLKNRRLKKYWKKVRHNVDLMNWYADHDISTYQFLSNGYKCIFAPYMHPKDKEEKWIRVFFDISRFMRIYPRVVGFMPDYNCRTEKIHFLKKNISLVCAFLAIS